MKVLIAILTAVMQALLPWAAKKTRPTAEDGDPDRATREKLREKVRRHWMIVIIAAGMLISGCGARTIYVPHGTPVRLRETLCDVKVWVRDGGGEPTAGRMDIYEGWYCLPVDIEE